MGSIMNKQQQAELVETVRGVVMTAYVEILRGLMAYEGEDADAEIFTWLSLTAQGMGIEVGVLAGMIDEQLVRMSPELRGDPS